MRRMEGEEGLLVSIHAPARGATRKMIRRLVPTASFQSTPPHGGQRASGPCRAAQSRVSIHAPARGATVTGNRVVGKALVSIHAPARGATRRSISTSSACRRFNPRPRTGGNAVIKPHPPAALGRFNPRPRTGGNVAVEGVLPAAEGVSIHAPARGATSAWCESVQMSQKFQSTPPHGGQRHGRDLHHRRRFQSTPPHGGQRQIRDSPNQPQTRFQSTPPHGGQRSQDDSAAIADQFQSTPPHGGQPQTRNERACVREFQSTPPHGGQPNGFRSDGESQAVSIHAPARGATPTRVTVTDHGCFNPRPRTGGNLDFLCV